MLDRAFCGWPSVSTVCTEEVSPGPGSCMCVGYEHPSTFLKALVPRLYICEGRQGLDHVPGLPGRSGSVLVTGTDLTAHESAPLDAEGTLRVQAPGPQEIGKGVLTKLSS